MATAGELYGRPWSEPEYIIVLADYFRSKGGPRHGDSPVVLKLAKLLGRTPASINMRMENFASLDRDSTRGKIGLTKVSKMCRDVYVYWHMKQASLSDCANVLLREFDMPGSQQSLFEPEPVAMPRAFGQYELLDPIGEGGFGRVFSCINTVNGEVCALKIIPTQLVRQPEALPRFIREIRALRRVNHPNVIKLLDDNLETERTFPAFVMTLATGSLTQHFEEVNTTAMRPPVRLPDAVNVVGSIAQALIALHQSGIIHRDVNPNNILRLEDGSWVLADFGLAKFIEGSATTTAFATRTHVGLGTAFYAAPEQYRDLKSADRRADIYALGMLVWELFSRSWPPPERSDSGLPDPLVPVFRRATERDADHRYRTVEDFAAAFAAAVPQLGE